jgi:hypothetical protein
MAARQRAGAGDGGARRAVHRGGRLQRRQLLNYGHDVSSLIMAVLWALALACYLTGRYLAARPVRP